MGCCTSRPERPEKQELRSSTSYADTYQKYHVPSTLTPPVTAELPNNSIATPSNYEHLNSRQTLSSTASTISSGTTPTYYNPLSSQLPPPSQVSDLSTGSVRTYQSSVVPSSRITPSYAIPSSSPPYSSFTTSQSPGPADSYSYSTPSSPPQAFSQQRYARPVTPPPPPAPTHQRFCLAPPLCRRCGRTGIRDIVRSPNPTGNAERAYYHCPDLKGCDEWICFDDYLGIEPGNPRCDCGELSRLQRASPAKGGFGFFKCARGQCWLYQRQ